jgi:methyltransferase (TIGR00027 family)
MQTDLSSKTAEYMAFFRALESRKPPGKRVIEDPFARFFLRPGLSRVVRLTKIPGLPWLVERYADRRLPGARTSAIARTRLIDDAWVRAIRDGICQTVILGAGFDCRALRLPVNDSALVYEVDHPATCRFKRERLAQATREFHCNVRFAAIDFNREKLAEVLAASGFDHARPALFLWEGVTNYLSQDAVDAVLRYVGTCAPGGRIVFTYVHRGVLDGSVAFFGAERIRRDVNRLGEPWTFGFEPAALSAYLRERNLILDYDAGAREYRRECFGPRGATMKGYDFYHVAEAHVATNR